ncbi:SAM-dependent methyltransferase [Streptomyces albipurpureus]|uniref:SAM-dependent methyltransferase n=1 Tax=Streptomyces albipurpureus TaxID=2897419 RepID=A0ABT0UJH5_9ACTN|nr:SAM-dependent methyltransferase [Streptomyces sp. CWNU-1]MCM2388782.1 SAM-dependent methyltransferase [Streptomyces sp. CWNU-1]
MSNRYEIRPIATVIGGHTEVADDYQGGVEALIRLHAEYPDETLRGLADFSHLVVTWHFHLATPQDVALHVRSPRNNPQWPATGTFAHRNHRRPNQLATSFPRVLGVHGRDIHVTDLDAVDGTPILDLAPYFPAMGPQGAIHTPTWVPEMLPDYWRNPDER